MIPSASSLLSQNIKFVEQVSQTFYLDTEKNLVYGLTDGQNAIKQAIYLILSIERYKYAILPWSYGVELEDLYGQPIEWVVSETERRITEALLQDTRIIAVNNFEFTRQAVTQRGKLTVAFTVQTIFGEIPIERSVDF